MSELGEAIALHYRERSQRQRTISDRLDSQWTKDRIATITAEYDALAVLCEAADTPDASRACRGALLMLADALKIGATR